MIRALPLLLFAAATWYFAGMYRSAPLAVLFAAEVLLILVMAGSALLFHWTLRAAFPAEQTAGEKGTPCPCRVEVEQKGILPASQVRLTFALSLPGKRAVIRRISSREVSMPRSPISNVRPVSSSRSFIFTRKSPASGIRAQETFSFAMALATGWPR